MEFGIWWILVKRCHGSLMDLMGEQGRSCRSSHVVLSRVPGVRIQDDPRTAVDPNDCKGMGTQETAHWCHECSEITDVLLPTTSWKPLYGIDVGKERPYVNDPMFPNVFNVFPSLSLCELCQRPSHSGFLRDQGQHMNLKLHTSLSLLLCSFLVFFLFLFFSSFYYISIYIYIYMCVCIPL